jgi:hypothetical protein
MAENDVFYIASLGNSHQFRLGHVLTWECIGGMFCTDILYDMYKVFILGYLLLSMFDYDRFGVTTGYWYVESDIRILREESTAGWGRMFRAYVHVYA